MKELVSKIKDYLIENSKRGVFEGGIKLVKNVKFLEIDEVEGNLMATVSDKKKPTILKVNIIRYLSYPFISNCTCSPNKKILCSHQVAVFLSLCNRISLELQEVTSGSKTKSENLPHTLQIKLNNLDDVYLLSFSDRQQWLDKTSSRKIIIELKEELGFNVKLTHGLAVHHLNFKKDFSTGYIAMTCTCGLPLQNKLCSHMIASLIEIRGEYGFYAFDKTKNIDNEKNQLLGEYGYSLQDDISQMFEFRKENGKLSLVSLDPSLRKLSQFENWRKKGMSLFSAPTVKVVPATITIDEARKWIVVLKFNGRNNNVNDLLVLLFSANFNPKTGKYTHLKEFNGVLDVDTPEISDPIKKLRITSKRLSSDALIDVIKRNYKPGLTYYSHIDADTLRLIGELNGKLLDDILPILANQHTCVPVDDPRGMYGISSYSNLMPISISTNTIKASFVLKEENDFIILEAFAEIENRKIAFEDLIPSGFEWFIEYLNIFYKWASYKDVQMMHEMTASGGKFKVRKSNFDEFFSEFVLPLSDNFSLDIKLDLKIENKSFESFEHSLYIKEEEESLLFIPTFQYESEGEKYEFEYDGRYSKIIYDNDTLKIYERNIPAERDVYEYIQSQHPAFEYQGNQEFFSLGFEEVLENGWLFGFYENLREKEIKVYGHKELKKFKFNPNKAKFEIKASSGIDWFDMQIGLSFGDQVVSMKDIKTAVVKKQNYVLLGDGTMGLLPEEWLGQYANLFKLGKIKGESVQLSKFHFSLIDELSVEIDNEEIRREIEEKKHKLLNFKNIEKVEPPKHLKAILRDYQLEGYNWLNFLDDYGWGGCLADDMGLGKTIQILAFLQNQKNKQKNLVNLVVVPTSLIFNWQAEVEKFCPKLKILVNHGQSRIKDDSDFINYDIVLTTYGTLRSDILIFKEYLFHYIILDESQAIKNGGSQVSKAVKLLKAKNRLVMTGTPVENNTFDLYSQFEFINPGLLGSEEFFKNEFANAIDKNQDKEASSMLRKMIYPFMLKRTKEEVAKDLPDKTETTLFCEMGPKQRKVYDAFRDKYRNQLISKFNTDGKEKSGMLILEALMKLRQICDSPALLSDEGEFTQDSIKLDEITREIEENASNHKILIFSQFLKMLDLIRNYLDKQGISYEYLDGSTTDRAARVNRFQSDKKCRVFLISLKAGGVGLNLTEADYVYLVDPWWNPAVEAQAIDRTHRIGQKNKVFAYKMICKDTIEEKILKLQEKKKEIASDLVGAETGFIKKLTKDDVLELFS